MANKRINSEAPLTAAEKQNRYRQKVKEEKRAVYEENMDTIRQLLHSCIDKMSEQRLIIFCNKLTETNNLASEREMCETLGISVEEFRKVAKKANVFPEQAKLDTNAFLQTVAQIVMDDDNVVLVD